MTNEQRANINEGHCLWQRMCQAIIWTSTGLVCYRMYVLLGLDELINDAIMPATAYKICINGCQYYI